MQLNPSAPYVELLSQNVRVTPPTLVRFGIEGFQPDVLAGAREVIPRSRPILAASLSPPGPSVGSAVGAGVDMQPLWLFPSRSRNRSVGPGLLHHSLRKDDNGKEACR